MSGLVTFFRGWLPDTEKENYDYKDSIQNVQNKEPLQPESPPKDPRTQSGTEFRAYTNESLRLYMGKRMVKQEEDDEDEDEDEDYVPDNDEGTVPFWTGASPGSDSTGTNVTSPHIKIPHIDETKHVATTLSALDLYTREFNLSLGLVTKVESLREVHRREDITSSFFENDGPLGTVFKKVVCMEVTPLHAKVATMAQAAFSTAGSHSPQRLLVFFYNKYALQISSLLERNHSERILISLQNIPAKCILPVMHTDDFTWFDRQGLSQCCLCIGDKSSMKLDKDGVFRKVPFDAPEVQVTIAQVSCNNRVAQIKLTPEAVREGNVEVTETDTLQVAYEEWEENQKKAQEEEEKEQQQEEEEEQGADAGTRRRADTSNDDRATKKARTEETYYTLNELRDLYESRKGGEVVSVNVYATVIGFSSPSLTKGYDWMVNVTLVDESTPLPDMSDDANTSDVVAATTCVIFCKNRDQLPKIRKAGDVMRLHRVGVQEWKGDIQLMGKRCSSYVVARPENTASTSSQDDWMINATAKGGTTFDQHDRERVSALWQWARARHAKYPTIHKLSEKLTVADLARHDEDNAEPKTGDMTIMVSAILPVPQALRNNSTPMGYLRVWDGTGPPTSDPLPVASAGAPEAIKNGDPPPEALKAIADAIERINSDDDEAESEEQSLEPPKCLCGRVTNVAVWEETHWLLVQDTLQVGSFIRLRNVHEGSVQEGLGCIILHTKSSLTPLPNDTYEIMVLLEDHQKRLARKDPFNPQSGVLPLDGDEVAVAATDSDDMDVDELPAQQDGFASIARCVSEAAPKSFKVKFQITGTIPSIGKGQHGLGPLVSNGNYQFGVNVNDETAAIDALVGNQVGVALFQTDATAAATLPPLMVNALMKAVTDKSWQGEINSFEVNGSKYFFLERLSGISDS